MGSEGTARLRRGQGVASDAFTSLPHAVNSTCFANRMAARRAWPAPPAWGVLALHRGETISAAWLVLAAVGTYLVAYRFYSRFLADRVFGLNDRRATPAERLANGRDFVPTSRWVLFGHHFAAIAGAGPAGRAGAGGPVRLPARARSGSCSAWCWAARCRTS